MTLPPLNTPIPHDGSATCPVHPETIVEVDDWRGKHWARSLNWKGVTAYTIVKYAPADEIAALQARVTELEGLLKRWITVAENCQIGSGVCGCGADMDNHPHDNHGPADYGTYVALKLAEDTRAALQGAPNAHD